MTTFPAIAAGRRRRGIGLVVLAAVVQAAAAAAAAFAMRGIFIALDQGTGHVPLGDIVMVAGAVSALALGRVSERTAAERLGYDFAGEVRVRLFRRVSTASAGQLAALRHDALSTRVVGDLKTIRNWVSLGLARLIAAAIMVPALAAVLVLLSPALALAALPVPVAGLAVLLILGPRLEPLHRRARRQAFGLAAEMIANPFAAIGLGRTRAELASIADRSKQLVDAAVRRVRAASILRAIPDIAWGVAAAMMVGMTVHHDLAPFDLVAALAVLTLMLAPIRDMAGIGDRHRAWSAARTRCLRALDRPAPVGTGNDAGTPPSVVGLPADRDRDRVGTGRTAGTPRDASSPATLWLGRGSSWSTMGTGWRIWDGRPVSPI